MLLGNRKLAAWYYQLARLVEAGLPLAAALRTARGTGLPAVGLEAMAQAIESGGTVTDAFEAGARWLPASDRYVLSAAAEAGRMPRALNSLAERHARLGAAKLKLALATAYPLGVLHFGLLLLPIMRMISYETGFRWDAVAYAHTIAITMLPLWAVIALLWLLIRQDSPVIFAIGSALPFIRGYFLAQSLADFAFALGNFLDAGLRIDRAWSLAGSVARRPDLSRAAIAVHAAIERGERPGLQLAAWPCFPPDFIALYHTGETTGQLEQNLLRLADTYQNSANRAITSATFLYPLLAFLGVAAIVVFNVFKYYAGYLKMIEKLAS